MGSNKKQMGAITANLKNLAPNKAARFNPDAMNAFEGDRSFERVNLNTQYLSRISQAI